MFTVYGVSGRLFKGSIDQLRQIGGVTSVARTRTINAIGRDGEQPKSAGDTGYAGLTSFGESQHAGLSAYAAIRDASHHRQQITEVSSLMSQDVISIPDTATAHQAWQLMVNHDVVQAPVVSATGTLVGLLAYADLFNPKRVQVLNNEPRAWRILMEQKVGSLMTTPVPSVAPETDIRRVAGALMETGLPGLPVVDEQGAVTGFISRTDILRAVAIDPPLDVWG